MSFPVASGYPQNSGVYIPEVWAGKLLVKFYDSTVLGSISNTDYEGEIKSQGDTVHIRTVPSISVNDYVKGQKIVYETPESNLVDLLIDKGKSWSFRDDDVDRKQADIAYLDSWTADAAEQMKIAIDTQVLGDVYADAHADNIGTTAGRKSSAYNMGTTGSPVGVDKTTVVEYIADMGTVLDEQNVPQEGRFLVAPPWLCNLIKKSDLKDASLSGDGTSMLRNGRVGMIDRFTIYMSNLLTSVTDGDNTPTNMLFGHKSAITFAAQLTESEGPIRHPDYFGNFYRGLQVYGYEVIKPEALGNFYAYKA